MVSGEGVGKEGGHGAAAERAGDVEGGGRGSKTEPTIADGAGPVAVGGRWRGEGSERCPHNMAVSAHDGRGGGCCPHSMAASALGRRCCPRTIGDALRPLLHRALRGIKMTLDPK